MKYCDIDKRKTAFIFELDDVLYPEKDYLYQVYYLFANLLEYSEFIDAKQTTDFLVEAYLTGGNDAAFNYIKKKLNVDEKHREALDNLLKTAKLPLKLLPYKNILSLVQEIVVDRKKPFIVTNGNPQQQLNKIKQTEWHGLENYMTVYFAEETIAKPEPDAVNLLIKNHDLKRRDLIMIGETETDSLCAEVCGIDFINVKEFL